MLPKPKRTLVRGSAADFRRREANRLAADRSRIRASEKRTSLESAYATLTEDNARLKAEIEKLERETGHGGVVEPIHEDEPEVSSGDHAQDSHSRTILAALMSAGQHETFETDMAHALEGVGSGDDSWMQGMEDMLKDAESSGRLGELARLAAGRNGPAEGEGAEETDNDTHPAPPAATADEPVEQTAEAEASDTADRLENTAPGSAETEPPRDGQRSVDTEDKTQDTLPATPGTVVLKKVEYDPGAALAAATSKIAVTINADMEKIIRDELAVTKAVLASVNKEIARLQALSGEERKLDAWKRDPERVACLPNDVFSDDGSTLKNLADTGKAEVETLEARLPEFRGKVRAARGEKLQEEGQLAKVVMRLQKLGVDGGHEEDRGRTEKVLKGITGYVGQLLGTAAELVSRS